MAEVTITAKVSWREVSGSITGGLPLRNVYCMLTIASVVPSITHGYLDENGCIKAKVESTCLDFAKQIGKSVNAVIFLFPNTKDCNVVYRENTKDKYNAVSLQAEVDLNNKKVDFFFHLNPRNGYHDPDDPKTFVEQCDRRRLVVASIMQFGANFIRNRLGKTPDHVTCYYPKRFDVVDTSYALVSIHLKEVDYLSLFTILHEYGHKCYGMYRNYTRIPIADHSGDVDLTANHLKTRGIYTAFIEGFASYFAYKTISAYREYFKEFNDTLPLLEEAERNCVEFSAHGEANESSVSNFLVDMGDPINPEEHAYSLSGGNVFGNWLVPHEELSIADKAIVNLVAEQEDQNFYSFTQQFYKKYPQYTEAFNNILSMQGFAPSGVYATKVDDKEVSINWVPGGTKESYYFKDDKLVKEFKPCKTYQTSFDVIVCDAEFNVLKKYRVNDKESLTFPYNIVEGLDKKSNYFLVKIKGYSYTSPKTEYESSYFHIDFNSYAEGRNLVIIPSIFGKVPEGKRTSMTIGDEKVEIMYAGCGYDNRCNMYLYDKNSFFQTTFSEEKYTRVKVSMADRPTGRYIGEKYFLEVTYFNGQTEKVQLESKSTIVGIKNSVKFIKRIEITGENLEERLLKIVRIKFMKNTFNICNIDDIKNPRGPKGIHKIDKGDAFAPGGIRPIKSKK